MEFETALVQSLMAAERGAHEFMASRCKLSVAGRETEGKMLRDRMDVEFVEADVEIGFNLVDMAERESRGGDLPLASRVLRDAEGVFKDIERRLQSVGRRDRECFGPLVQELRRAIDVAKLHALPQRFEDPRGSHGQLQ
jgi:hypothetical protein